MCGWRSPRRHRKRASTILSAVLAVQLIREMGRGLVGSLGLGMGWMSASFHAEGKQPAIQEELIRARSAASLSAPAWASME
ncbi:hypothetical protein GWK47_010091 [Chionoecetes opilio]|uniref:Uncharacterized protein n=1 Tax=Chionoecetes opilio TaxID=41210 RepID=A0A8J4XYS3_CHIOP|nr:hypothetical protein GWK47_010091 [Chionoecetes opilio]